MPIHERFPNHGPNLLHHHLMDGGIFAEPRITDDGEMVMTIVGWNFEDGCEAILDRKAMFNGFPTVHHIPVRVLDCGFYVPNQKEGMLFTEGGRYHRIGEWEFPFFGQRLGAWVKRYDANAKRESDIEHSGAANA